MLLVGCAANKQECQNSWNTYVVKLGEDPKTCEFNNSHQLKIQTKSKQIRVLRNKYKDLHNREVCPFLKSWLDSQLVEKKRIQSLIKEVKAEKYKILDRDGSFDIFSVQGNFANWTVDESIVISSGVARNTYSLYEDTKDGLFDWGSFLIKDYPLISELKQKGFVVEEGFLFVGTAISFRGLFYMGTTRLFNPHRGYFEVHTFSFRPPKNKRKSWYAMRSELKKIESDLGDLKEQIKALTDSRPKEVKQNCRRWVSPEKKNLLSDLDQVKQSLETDRSCIKIKTSYLRSLAGKYKSCTQTLLEDKR